MPVSPTLFSALQRLTTGAVRIKNEGVPFIAGRLGGRPQQFGEEYELSCPFCGDTRRRMAVSATYRPNVHDHAWYCHHEHCHQHPENRKQLSIRVAAAMVDVMLSGEMLVSAGIPSQPLLPTPKVTPQLPSGTVSVRDLPRTHTAHRYLIGRGFDPLDLSDRYRIGFADGSDASTSVFRDPRIVIPILFANGELEAWQARSLKDARPKYLSMAGWRKTHSVFIAPGGLPAGESMIVVEGVFDAIRAGASGVALFGKEASPEQVRTLVRLAAGCPRIVIALDRDAAFEAEQLATKLRRALPPSSTTTVIVATLPVGKKDLGECTPDQVRSWRLAIEQTSTPLATTTVAVPQTGRQCRDYRSEAGHRLLKHAGIEGIWSAEELESQIHNAGLSDVWSMIEVPLLPVIAKIESIGVPIDQEVLRAAQQVGDAHSTMASRLLSARRLDNGRVALSINLLGTKTGRITVSNFAFQSLAKRLRQAITAPAGRMFVAMDYQSFEVRIIAAVCGDPDLRELMSQDDPYRTWAATLLRKAPDAVTEKERAKAKRRFISAFYGARAESAVRAAFSGFAAWEHRCQQSAKALGVVVNPLGRRIQCLPGDTKKAPCWLIQSTGADIFKRGMRSVDDRLPAAARILLPMHDGLLVECDAADASSVALTLKQLAFDHAGVQFPVSVQVGRNWGECTS